MSEKKSVHKRLQTACGRWNLTEIDCVYEKENSGVYRAESVEFGPVILKIHPDTSLSGEYKALMEMGGEVCCKVYAFDGGSGLLLEERIAPGTPLRETAAWESRAASFGQVFETIHVVPECGTAYPSYLDWVRKAYTSVADQGNQELSGGMHLAVAIAEELFGKYPERFLLHGDLHHDNILKDEMGNYRIIDPKGVVGPPIFDIPRFVLNELDDGGDSLRRAHMERVVRDLSGLLDYPEDDVCRLFFMEVMLANAWCFESGEEIAGKDLKLAWEMLRSVYDTERGIGFHC